MQRTSLPLPARLARVNPTGVFLATLVLILVALFAPGLPGATLALLLAAALVALSVLTWSVQTATNRVIRLVAVTLLIVLALTKLL
ncbi:hypothetical protein ABT336_04090 [Micromonospora sp. NPDC000207]|uniref:hypothetical protein n=1 Tax=Micromonospora sp. NPDC000207 TaxID=3154246 RepID=UPI00332BB480